MKLSWRYLCVVLVPVIVICLDYAIASGNGGSRYINTGSYTGPRRANVSIYDPLVKYLLNGYSPLAMPICSGKQPLHMMLDMWLYQLFDLDEPKQELILDVWIDLNWSDCSISWEPGDFNGINEVVLPSSDIWQPDIFSYQGLHGNYEEGLFIFKESKVKINHKGVVQLGAQLLLKTFCRVNIANFPFDEQVCPITFSAWNKDLTVFNMTKKPQHSDNAGHRFTGASNGEWYVMGLSASDSFQTFKVGSDESKTEKFSEVTFTLQLKRKPRFIQVYLMFPCMVLLWLGSITFLLPVNSGEKVSLVSTVLLSMIVLLLIVASYVPHTSDNVPIIAKFYFSSIALVAVAMLMTTIVLNLSHKHHNITMPPSLQGFLYSSFGNFFCFSFQRPARRERYSMIKWSNAKETQEATDRPSTDDSVNDRINEWVELGQLLDRMFLLIYVVLCMINTVYMLSVG